MGNLFSVEDEVKEALQRNDEAFAAAKIQEYLDKEGNIPLNIAITGESGSGKSTFVNALRGLDDDDEGAAPTGVTENSKGFLIYFHPDFPSVKLWDLPGIGTMRYPPTEYLKQVGFEKFDFFIIISCDHFRENDVKLAKEIQKMKKKFYFVCSKIDQYIENQRRREDFNGGLQRTSVQERTLKQIRENYTQSLQEHGFESPQVFLVSSKNPLLFDFPFLEETLERELPELKRDAFLGTFPTPAWRRWTGRKRIFSPI